MAPGACSISGVLRVVTVAGVLSLSLTACSGHADSATKPVQPGTVRLDCGAKNGDFGFEIDRKHPDFSEAWAVDWVPFPTAQGRVACFVQTAEGEDLRRPLGSFELAAWDAVETPDKTVITAAYQRCAVHDIPETENFPDSLDDFGAMDVARAMLALCPEHPEAETVRKRVKAYDKEASVPYAENPAEDPISKDSSFEDGDYRVGGDIDPGSYVAREPGDCYWERLDRRGEIIDNNFAPNAMRVQVDIDPDDYSFHSEGCGLWEPVS